jgi:hypothetical protein
LDRFTERSKCASQKDKKPGALMILYHFTSLYNLENVGPENIMAVGLKAMPCTDWLEKIVGKVSCVWLTTNPDLSPIYHGKSEVRIKLVIPSSDRRLVYVPKLLQKRCRPEELANLDADIAENFRSFYMYLADIPLDRLRAVEYADAAFRKKMLSSVPDDRPLFYAEQDG